jgi:hypothetical protein
MRNVFGALFDICNTYRKHTHHVQLNGLCSVHLTIMRRTQVSSRNDDEITFTRKIAHTCPGGTVHCVD